MKFAFEISIDEEERHRLPWFGPVETAGKFGSRRCKDRHTEPYKTTDQVLQYIQEEIDATDSQ